MVSERELPKPHELELTKGVGVVFPGQGTQRVGMGKEIFENSAFARTCWKKADEIIGYPLSKIAFEGPADTLTKTVHAQPAIFVDNYIRQKLLEHAGIIPRKNTVVAGHSLGEFSALAAAGVFTFEDAVWLVKRRGELMQEACESNPGGMVAVNLGEMDQNILNIMKQYELEKSIVNSGEQTVLSGRTANLKEAMEYMERNKIVAKSLDVAGGYHSSLFQSAAEKFLDVLRTVHKKSAKRLVIANSTATFIRTPDQVDAELARQLTRCVLWEKTLEQMPEETSDVSESGILSRMMDKVHRGKGKVERMKETIRGAVINFSVWRKNPMTVPQPA